MKKRKFTIISMIMLGMAMFLNVNAQSSANDKADAKAFVQKFYDWYVVLYNAPVNKKHPVVSDVVAVNKKPDLFLAPLRMALIDDANAQSKVKGDIVGLDFDPFLAAQDNVGECQTGNVKQTGNDFFVDVHYATKGKSKKAILASKTAVIAEVIKVGTNWKFANFIYPNDERHENLLQILANLRKDRGTK